MDNDGIPDTIDVDGGDGTGEAALGTVGNPSADMLFENVVTSPEFNVTNKLEGTLNRINDNPNFRAFTSGSKSLVDAAGFVNRVFDKRAYNDALDQMEERSGADYKYGVTTSDPFSEGFYDANSGQLQGEAERTPGYYMNFAGSPNSYGMAKTGGEIVELSQDMIAQLIAAGADIEII